MALHSRHLIPPKSLHHRRGFATRYTAKVTSASPSGRSLSAEVPPPPPLPTEVRGYPIPRRDLICSATNILLRGRFRPPSDDELNNAFSHLSKHLESLSVSLTPSEASEILKSLKWPRLALRFFRFCPSLHPDFRHDAVTYNRILLILFKSADPDRFDQVRSIVAEMERSNVRGTVSTVNILIGIFGDTEDLERSVELAKRWGVKLNSYTYRCLVQAYLRSYNSKKALDVYVEMRRRGYGLDRIAYNMLLNALAKDEMVDEAYQVFEDMKKKCCNPDEFSFTILIRMTGKVGKPHQSLALFQEMIESGHSPNVITYNTTLEALAKGKMVDRAIHLFSKMMKEERHPNEFTYSVLLDLLISAGQLGRLDELVEISKKYINRSIYAYLVKTLGKLGHASEAHRLFCNMWNYHERGDGDASISMLDCLCKAGKTTEAMDLLKNIHEKGVDTNTRMYNMVFSALGKTKQISHLHDLYQTMKNQGPSPDIFTYNILISNFGRAGKVDEALQIFEELEQSNCMPDVVSYNSLINILGKNGDVDEAHIRFREMQERGLDPDVFTYSVLIECFGKTDKVDMACQLFDEMIARECFPNIVTYNIMLDCLVRYGRTAQAVDLYAKLKEQGLTPDSITYSILERLQGGSHRKVRVRRKNPITGWIVSPL